MTEKTELEIIYETNEKLSKKIGILIDALEKAEWIRIGLGLTCPVCRARKDVTGHYESCAISNALYGKE